MKNIKSLFAIFAIIFIQSIAFSMTDSKAYTILDLQNGSSNAEIKKAYNKLVLKLHPDKLINANEQDQENAKVKFEKVSEAYQYFMDKLTKSPDGDAQKLADEKKAIAIENSKDWVKTNSKIIEYVDNLLKKSSLLSGMDIYNDIYFHRIGGIQSVSDNPTFDRKTICDEIVKLAEDRILMNKAKKNQANSDIKQQTNDWLLKNNMNLFVEKNFSKIDANNCNEII